MYREIEKWATGQISRVRAARPLRQGLSLSNPHSPWQDNATAAIYLLKECFTDMHFTRSQPTVRSEKHSTPYLPNVRRITQCTTVCFDLLVHTLVLPTLCITDWCVEDQRLFPQPCISLRLHRTTARMENHAIKPTLPSLEHPTTFRCSGQMVRRVLALGKCVPYSPSFSMGPCVLFSGLPDDDYFPRLAP